MAADPVFEPVNDLERVLARAKAGFILVPTLLEEMLRSQVVVLFDREVGPEGWDSSTSPLILTTPEGGPGLCVFTAVERAMVWLQRFPTFEYALSADFAWLLQGVGPTTAILVNPGWAEGLAIPPDQVLELKRAVQAA